MFAGAFDPIRPRMRGGKIKNVKIYGKWGANVPLAIHPVDAVRTLLGKRNRKLGLELDYCSAGFCSEVEDKLCPDEVVSYFI